MAPPGCTYVSMYTGNRKCTYMAAGAKGCIALNDRLLSPGTSKLVNWCAAKVRQKHKTHVIADGSASSFTPARTTTIRALIRVVQAPMRYELLLNSAIIPTPPKTWDIKTVTRTPSSVLSGLPHGTLHRVERPDNVEYYGMGNTPERDYLRSKNNQNNVEPGRTPVASRPLSTRSVLISRGTDAFQEQTDGRWLRLKVLRGIHDTDKDAVSFPAHLISHANKRQQQTPSNSHTILPLARGEGGRSPPHKLLLPSLLISRVMQLAARGPAVDHHTTRRREQHAQAYIPLVCLQHHIWYKPKYQYISHRQAVVPPDASPQALNISTWYP